MADPKKEKRGDINGMSFGRIMTSLLIPKDSRSNPKRIISGIAFLAFICFFLLSALGRGCQRETEVQQPEQRISQSTIQTDSIRS
ncbi:protein of unknown function [Pseudodesulfovibrio profundus]|uniref:Uncharacterized protein n=1 Tax=Pseudodesulfovibrio profundus TaxID=57320 RepID=A0A2C8F733_9BACT|nr:hypothetical protein [Pseudodesulfovibrio profundus]SOB58388.1 protein of unknown function [Pseudodesulfovibrio profundus]